MSKKKEPNGKPDWKVRLEKYQEEKRLANEEQAKIDAATVNPTLFKLAQRVAKAKGVRLVSSEGFQKGWDICRECDEPIDPGGTGKEQLRREPPGVNYHSGCYDLAQWRMSEESKKTEIRANQ